LASPNVALIYAMKTSKSYNYGKFLLRNGGNLTRPFLKGETQPIQLGKHYWGIKWIANG
jgi:hypothetical protein